MKTRPPRRGTDAAIAARPGARGGVPGRSTSAGGRVASGYFSRGIVSAEWPQRLAHGGGGGVAVVGLAGEAPLEDVGQCDGDVAAAGPDRDGVLLEQGADQVAPLGHLVVDELAGQQVVERGGGGVEVA